MNFEISYDRALKNLEWSAHERCILSQRKHNWLLPSFRVVATENLATALELLEKARGEGEDDEAWSKPLLQASAKAIVEAVGIGRWNEVVENDLCRKAMHALDRDGELDYSLLFPDLLEDPRKLTQAELSFVRRLSWEGENAGGAALDAVRLAVRAQDIELLKFGPRMAVALEQFLTEVDTDTPVGLEHSPPARLSQIASKDMRALWRWLVDDSAANESCWDELWAGALCAGASHFKTEIGRVTLEHQKEWRLADWHEQALHYCFEKDVGILKGLAGLFVARTTELRGGTVRPDWWVFVMGVAAERAVLDTRHMQAIADSARAAKG